LRLLSSPPSPAAAVRPGRPHPAPVAPGRSPLDLWFVISRIMNQIGYQKSAKLVPVRVEVRKPKTWTTTVSFVPTATRSRPWRVAVHPFLRRTLLLSTMRLF
jgi:hypothetical protein